MDAPGYMLALEDGGTCHGVIHRIRADKIDSETRILWRREMLGTGYRSIWTDVQTSEGPQRAITFIVNRDSPRYVGQPDNAELIARIARAEGADRKKCRLRVLLMRAPYSPWYARC